MKKDVFCALFGIQNARIQRHTMQERAGAYACARTRASESKAREKFFTSSRAT